MEDLLGVRKKESHPDALSVALRTAITAGEIIWQSSVCEEHAVVKLSPTIVVKIVPSFDDYTEYTSMQYLAEHRASIPAPKPLGLLRSEKIAYFFMTYIPGVSVEKVWPML